VGTQTLPVPPLPLPPRGGRAPHTPHDGAAADTAAHAIATYGNQLPQLQGGPYALQPSESNGAHPVGVG